MKTRIKAESLLALAATDRPTGAARVYSCIVGNPSCTYTFISQVTGLRIPTVVGRLNDLMYLHECIIADGTYNNKALYRPRRRDEPAMVRPKSLAEQLQEQINEIKRFFNLSDADYDNIIHKRYDIIDTHTLPMLMKRDDDSITITGQLLKNPSTAKGTFNFKSTQNEK